jgi:hypothetical protein
MVVIRCGDDDRVELRMFKKLAVIGVLLSGREVLSGGTQTVFVDIAQGDDVFTGDRYEICGTASRDTDHTDVEPIVGPEHARAEEGTEGQAGPNGAGRF